MEDWSANRLQDDRKQKLARTHPCPERNSNRRSQCLTRTS